VCGEGGFGYHVIWRVWAQGPLTYLVASTSSQVEGPGSQGMCPAQASFSISAMILMQWEVLFVR
jgi:hypothetical protein